MSERLLRRKALTMLTGFLLTFGVLAGPETVRGQSNTVTVTGRVIGAGNVPKGLARIELTGSGQFVAMSDAVGQFTIHDITPGDYRVTVRQGGNFQTMVVKVSSAPLEIRVNW